MSVGYAYQLLVIVVGLWLAPFLLSRLGGDIYGLWLVATQILGYLLLMDLGVVALLPRETAFVTGRSDPENRDREMAHLVGATLRIVAWQMPLVGLAALLIWLLLPIEWALLKGPLAVVLALFVATFPFRVFLAVIQGLQDLAFLGLTTAAAWIIGTALTVGLVLAGFGIYAMALGWAAAQLITYVVVWIRMGRRFPGVIPRRLPQVTWGSARGYLSKSSWYSVSQLAQVFLAGSDLLIVGRLLGPGAVVPYAMTQKLISVLGNQPAVFIQNALPALAEMRALGDPRNVARVAEALSLGILILGGAVACVVIAVNRGFVSWWVGDAQYGGDLLTLAFVATVLLRLWNFSVLATMISFGHERRGSLTALADGILSVGGAIILTRWLGLVGAPVAGAASVALTSLPLNLAVVARETERTIGQLLMPIVPWAWRFLLIAGAGVAFARQWHPDSFLTLAITTLTIGGVYAVVMLPVARRSSLGPYVTRLVAGLRRLGSSALARARLV